MTLRIYNTLSRGLEAFAPIEPGHVRMYVCGITVYDLCHIGHARSAVAFDVVQRWLKASGLRVTFVRNITDIEDKIIRRALENGETIRQLTDRMIGEMYRDFDALGVQRPTHDPRATDYVPQMLDIVGRLQGKGLAYRSDNGDVNYAVRKFPGYGRLSGKTLDELQAGERVAVAEGKHDPLDFVLWKSAKPSEPEGAKWDSPFGLGRPGWHIECSAMSCALLGDTFDIHGGGADLQFPHHENEIAQSEGANGQPLARVWMHNGFVNIDNEKMSKSLGNFFTIREVLEQFDAETIRFFIVRAHYRSPLNYSDVHLQDARAALRRLYTALDAVPAAEVAIDWTNPWAARFKAAMDEDFGTPEAVAVLFELASEVNRARRPEDAGLLKALGGCLGLLQADPQAFLQAGSTLDEAAIAAQIEARAAAKKAKDFARADQIRAELLAVGVVLKDSPAGTTWEAVP
ncbi:MAG: cysteine--tRNA ligase [Ottowia sp.]|nr:cysteine--tRNA ligase [Pseudomonadota bacterium]MBS0597202.1 cysteine--tRNA ligase [Pseudomonadota bacterium]